MEENYYMPIWIDCSSCACCAYQRGDVSFCGHCDWNKDADDLDFEA